MPTAALMATNNDTHREYAVVDAAGVHDPDDGNKVKHVIQEAREDTEIFPHLNNYIAGTNTWDAGLGATLKDPGKRAALRGQILRFLGTYPDYRGLSLDFESLPDDSNAAYMTFIQELYGDLHGRDLRLYVNTAVATGDAELKQIAANSDGIILMNYDQHQTTSEPGPIAGQDWFVANLTRVLKVVPKKKIICAVGNYGYDWTLSIPDPKDRRHPKPKVLNTEDLPVSDAW